MSLPVPPVMTLPTPLPEYVYSLSPEDPEMNTGTATEASTSRLSSPSPKSPWMLVTPV